MRRLLTLVFSFALVYLLAASVFAQEASETKAAPKEQTLTGKITDAMCGAKHKMGEGGKMSDRECTLKCVKGGSKYAFATGDKVYVIANQDDPALEKHAGQKVQVTGTLSEDGKTITVAKLRTTPHISKSSKPLGP